MWDFKITKKIFLPVIIMAGIFTICNGFEKAKAYPLSKNDFCLTVVAMGKTYEFYYPEIDEYKGELYLKNIEQIVDGIYFDTLIKPKDAEVVFCIDKEYPFEFKKEQKGRSINKERLILSIEKALKKRKGKVEASEVVIEPYYTVEKLRKSTYRLSYFSTNYSYSSEERKNNIALATTLIGGVSLLPYEEFSFNQRVGERTEEKGFKNAKIIENGKFTDGVGGGVCQVSSTLYNAVLSAGLCVTERHSHSMLVSYVEPSFDAMVSIGYADLKFFNNTKSVIFLIAKTNFDNVEISVYGEKSEYYYERESCLLEKIAPPDFERVESDELLQGEEKITVYPKFGAISEGYLKIYKNGKMIEVKKLSTDKYSPMQGTVLFGKSRAIS